MDTRDEAMWWRSMPLTQLRTKLRGERQRALANHWAYDLPRHRAMLEVFKQRVAVESPATRKSIEEFV